jgi:hypothetical protein
MTDAPPPLPPFKEDGHMTVEPRISFTIERIIVAYRNEICRAWTDPEQLKRWIVPPDQDLVSCYLESEDRMVWYTKSHADSESCVEHVLDCQTWFPYSRMEIAFYTSAVPGMMDEHPVFLQVELQKQERDDTVVSTDYKLTLQYHNATLWRYTSRIDLHTFWLEATERLTRLIERSSTLSKATTPTQRLQIS